MNIRVSKVGTESAETVRRTGYDTFYETWHPFYAERDMDDYLRSAFVTEEIKAELADEQRFNYLLVFVDDHPVGYAKLVFHESVSGFGAEPVGEIERFYLFKSHHGKGVAQVLMDAVFEVLLSRGIRWAMLGVDVNNHRAIRFYSGYGFEVYGKKIFKVGSVNDTDQLMKLDLRTISPRNPSV